MAKRVFKTTKKLSGGRCTYRAWKDWESGDLIIGTYKGNKLDQYNKPNWLLQVEDAQFSNSKEAKKLIGQVIGLNSAGMLNKAMEKIEEGSMVQIIYNGTSEIEEGKYAGKDSHLFDVDLVTEDSGEEEETEETEDDDI